VPSLLGRGRPFLVAYVVLRLLVSSSALHSQTPPQSINPSGQNPPEQTTEDYNQRLEELRRSLSSSTPESQVADYRIGAQDLLEIKVFEAADLNRSLRVSASGEISFPLFGSVQAAGLTAQELQALLEFKLHKYMKDPHVDVLVSSVESHPISVVGAVKKPGVFQVRGLKTVLEMLSSAEGLADDAGDDVIIMRGAGLRTAFAQGNSQQQLGSGQPSPSEATPARDTPSASDDLNGSTKESVRVNLKDLLETGNPRFNVTVYPGDIVNVPKSGIVYVVGEVKKPGGFVLKSNEKMTVLKAMALAEGLTPTSVKNRARIIRTDAGGTEKVEIPIDLAKILDGKAPDPDLKPADIVFIPNSTGRYAAYKGSEAAISAITSLLVFRW
jgi:polysaccharide export outer membrane protein